ncbi:MAG TPA: DMT family transporter [Chitinophagales bacterium]|nr:DMT family transporter [Chitinophagales bacterium]MCB9075357.1 EamA family transporter [Chitinophagales bacterium]HMU97448.1 DMT family transporter [Chitinophagales bacterium]HMV01961.1 DMT family transporter [Chitinophagales bacterium]HMW95497.1 DMT family transporter [Chitinophagales bacterium]
MDKQVFHLTSQKQKGIFFVIIGAICFSSKGVLAKLAYRYGVSSLDVLNLRMLFSLPFYLFIYFRETKRKPIAIKPSIRWDIVLLGLIGYYLAALFDFKGLEYVSANLERITIFIYPTFVLLLGFIFYRRKVSLVQLISVLICYVGIVLAFYADIDSMDFKKGFIGVVFVLLSALTYAFYLVRSDNIIKNIGTLRFTCLSMMVSCIAVLIHNFLVNGFNLLSFSMNIYIICGIIAIGATVLPSFLMTYGISLIGSSNMSIIASIGPVSTMFLAYYILGESMTWMHILGTILVLLGIYILSKRS